MVTENAGGFSLPFRIENGSVAWQIEPVEKLKENIVHILLTDIGERVMQREYGGGLRQLIHDPNDEALKAIIQHQITRAIIKWEPRVAIQNVAVHQSDGTLFANIHYVVRRTQQLDQLSIPLTPK